MRIFTVKQGTSYTAFDVDRIHTGARAWIEQAHSFHCITDDNTGLANAFGIDCVRLPNEPALRGWWSKLFQFNLVSDEPTLYFDLDVALRSPLWQLGDASAKIGMPLDYLAAYRPERNIEYTNSSIMFYQGDYSDIFRNYMDNWQDIQKQYRGDQEFLWGEYRDRIEYLPKGISESYEWAAKPRGYATTPVVIYHGKSAKKDLR